MTEIIYMVTSLPCDRQCAFEQFTDNEHVEAWLTEVADIEPVKGGKFELFWNLLDRTQDSTIGCTITGIEPGRFLSFEWKGPQQFAHFMNTKNPLTHVVVFFIPCPEAPDHCTEVHLVHSGWEDSDEWEAARQWFENQWKLAFTRLNEYVRENQE